MYQVELGGSYEEMGRQHGYPLKQVGMTLPPPNFKMLRFAGQCEESVGQYAPELLEEMQGVAEAAGVDYEALVTLTITAPFELEDIYTPSCTVLAVMPERTVNGHITPG